MSDLVKSLKTIGLSAALLASTTAVSSAEDGGIYLGLRGIGSFGMVEDIKTSGFAGALEERNTEDPTAGVGGVVGYRFSDIPLRTELEVAHRFRMDLDLRDLGTPATGFENNLATTSALFNFAFEARNSTDFTPYVGASIGWSRNHSSVDRKVSGQAAQTFENDTDNLALGVLGGVNWQFADHWDMDLGYRFINLGDVDTGDMSGDKITGEYTSHDVLLTVGYRF